MNKRTARRLAAATAISVPGALGVAGVANAGTTFLTPRANTTVGGKTVTIYAQFSAPRPVVSVKLFLDDTVIAQRAFRPGGVSGTVNFVWDSTVAPSGAHRVTLKMYDKAGQVVGVQTVPVSVMNGGSSDVIPPQVTIIAPSPNTETRGTFDVKVLATDNSTEAPYVSLFVDKELRSVSNRQPYSVTVDTTEYANGSHVLEAWAYDAASNKGTATPVPFRVNNIGGATTLQPEPNPVEVTPPAEVSAPTEVALPVVPEVAPARPTTILPVAPVLKASTKPAPKPQVAVVTPKKAVAPAPAPKKVSSPTPAPKVVVAKAPVPKVLVAKAVVPEPVLVPVPEPPIQEIPDAAPIEPMAPVTEPGVIAELPIETPVVTEVAPAPAPKPTVKAVVPALAKTPAKSISPTPSKPAPKPVAAPVVKPTPVIVLKMKGEKVIEATSAPKPAAVKQAPKPSVKTMVAKALPVETGNPAPTTKRLQRAPAPTAPIVRAHTNPAPVKVAAIPKPPKSTLAPVIVRELPGDRVHKGRILHSVRYGETASQVAHRYGVPLKRLMAANGLNRRSSLQVGQTITVPSPVRVAFNNQPVAFDVAPRITNGVTTAALRQICEAAGAQVSWNAESKEVRITGLGRDIVVHVGSNQAEVDGRRVSMETAANLQSGRTLVPVRFLTEALKLKAEYDLRSGEIALSRA